MCSMSHVVLPFWAGGSIPPFHSSRVQAFSGRRNLGGVLVEQESIAQLTREQRRSRRKRSVRARTISVQRMSRREFEVLRRRNREMSWSRPVERASCADGPRPCPHVSCRHHLYLDVSPKTGAIKLNFPDLEVWELAVSCALDVADQGGTTLEEVGAIMNLTRERIRQLELKALSRLETLRDMCELREFVE